MDSTHGAPRGNKNTLKSGFYDKKKKRISANVLDQIFGFRRHAQFQNFGIKNIYFSFFFFFVRGGAWAPGAHGAPKKIPRGGARMRDDERKVQLFFVGSAFAHFVGSGGRGGGRKQLCSHRLAANLAYLTWYQTGCQTRYYPLIWGMNSIHGSYP